MARTHEAKQNKSDVAKSSQSIADLEESTSTEDTTNGATPEVSDAQEAESKASDTQEAIASSDDVDDVLNALKTLLSTVEKLQKARQEVGDIKPLLIQMLDGEMMSGDDLDQLKSGINGLFKLVRSYSDYQTALTKAQPARSLLDQVLKSPNAPKS